MSEIGYSEEVVKKVREEFENKRKIAADTSQAHQYETYQKCPLLREVDRALEMTGLKVFNAALEGKNGLEERIEKLKEENLELQRQKKALLTQCGFPEDYTEIKYSCPKCSDTGYVGIDMCSCMRKALVREAYAHSGLGKVLNQQTFENFRLDYYQDSSQNGSASQREIMRSILEKAKQYVYDFGVAGKESNLLFVGKTGLGKTHITTSIAKGVIDKGFDVVYDSAQNIIRAFEMERFERDNNARNDVERYFDCDLLIIDDLGTEMRNSFTLSSLYNLVNTRINNGKAMIISSNLEDLSLFPKTYDERITSRLLGNFRTLHFEGTDIRLMKARAK